MSLPLVNIFFFNRKKKKWGLRQIEDGGGRD